MYNKVEICGVNTASLKVLEEGEKIRLIEEWQAGRRSARDELVSGNLRLVLSLVQRFAGRGENLDDLFQVGCIGLIKAVDHFDITVGVRFSTYAVPLIIGEIRRYLRDNSSMRISRSLRDTAYRAMQIKEKLQSDYAREPTIEEIAQVLEEPKEDVVIALEAVTPPVSLYETVYAEGGDALCVMDQIRDRRDDRDWLEELALKEAIRQLSERERTILQLRFFKGLTQTQVSERIGISQAQVSRLEKNALTFIKNQL